MSNNPKDSLLGKIAAYTEILTTDPRSTIFVSLSEAYRKMGMLEEASKVANEGLKHLPDYCPGHVVLARIKCQQGDLAGSEVSFKTALEIDSSSLAALVGFSRLYLLQGRDSEARAILLRARNISPADPVINKLLLSLPESERQEVVPSASVKEDIPVPASTAEPLESATLAELYLKQGLADKALDIYRNLLARDPDNLQLRRRIRDLETDLSVENAPGEGQYAAGNEPVVKADMRPEVSGSANTVPVLDQLNRLLQSIQRRRGDV